MKTLFLSSLISFCLLIFLLNKRHSKMEKSMKDAFWKREEEANHTRRKSLDNLPYITIPLEELPLACHITDDTADVRNTDDAADVRNTDDTADIRNTGDTADVRSTNDTADVRNTGDAAANEAISEECKEILRSLSTQKIVNLTGYTNTDLKLSYGTANITCLTEYDQNYTLLVSTLQKWAEALYRGGAKKECRQVLEYAVSIGTDVSHTYFLLADLYDEEGESDLKCSLIEKASGLSSLSSKVIVRTLQGSGPYSGWLRSGSDAQSNTLP